MYHSSMFIWYGYIVGLFFAFGYIYVCTLPKSYFYSHSFGIVWFASNMSFIVFGNLLEHICAILELKYCLQEHRAFIY